MDDKSHSRRGPWQSKAHRLIRLVLALAAAGAITGVSAALVVRAAGHGAFFIGPSLIGPSREVAAFLTDLRDGRYAQAYSRICPEGADGQGTFITRFAATNRRGHAVASFRLRTTFADDSTSLSSAIGTVTFRDGATASVLFDLEPFNEPTCIAASGYADLLG